MNINETLNRCLEINELKKFDDVHIISKNKTGMVYDIKGNEITVQTVSGLMTVNIKDIKKLNEKKDDYEIYHRSYTSAVQTALDYVVKRGYTTNDEEVSDIVGFGPKKPGAGKTNQLHIPIYKGDKKQKKMLHITVYNRDVDPHPYELTTYIL